jgi:hypothetical protein
MEFGNVSAILVAVCSREISGVLVQGSGKLVAYRRTVLCQGQQRHDFGQCCEARYLLGEVALECSTLHLQEIPERSDDVQKLAGPTRELLACSEMSLPRRPKMPEKMLPAREPPKHLHDLQSAPKSERIESNIIPPALRRHNNIDISFWQIPEHTKQCDGS